MSRHSSRQTERRVSCIFRSSKLFALISLHSAATCGPLPFLLQLSTYRYVFSDLRVREALGGLTSPSTAPPSPVVPSTPKQDTNRAEKQNKTKPQVEKHIVLPLRWMSTDATLTAGLCNLHFILFSQGLLASLSTHKALVLSIYLFFN